MRLLTHNFLKSTVRGTTKGYPLKIQAETVEILESEMDETLLQNMLLKIDYDTLRSAVSDLQDHLPSPIQLPETLPEKPDATMLQSLYTALFDLHVWKGQLICPDSQRSFPITDGIPNMILHEDEL